MTERYSKILVTKLKPTTHERLKKLAEHDRRTLSALSRIIIEDYMGDIKVVKKENREV